MSIQGGEPPTDPRLDWRTRLPVPGVPSPTGPPPPSRPIDAPPAPQQLRAPHNLFTLEEATTALQLLTSGLLPSRPTEVLVTHVNGGDADLLLNELASITYAEDVTSVHVSWTYRDGSQVVGDLIDRSDCGLLAVKGEGLALAAAQQCLEHLAVLRQQRARLRGFLAGTGPQALWLLLLVAVCLTLVALGGYPSSTPSTPLTTSWLIGAVFICLLSLSLSFLLTGYLRWQRRRFSGTRLARRSRIERTPSPEEISAFATAAGPPLTVVAILMAAIFR